MKKVRIAGISALMLLLIATLFWVSGCSKNRAFVDGTYNREEGYAASFRTKYLVMDDLTMHMKEAIFEEDMARNAAKVIEDDYKQIQKAGKGQENAVAVYLVDKTLSGKPQTVGDKLFCTPEDIQTGEYRLYLTQVSFRLSCLWKGIGLDWYIFGVPETKSVQTERLKAYYDEKINMSTLSLLPVYFIEEFSDADTISVAENTAFSLTEYIISNSGLSEYLIGDSVEEYRKEWLQSIGAVGDSNSLRITGDAMSFTVSEEYPAVIGYENYTFNFAPTDWLKDGDDIYVFLADLLEGCDSLFSTLEKTEPETYAIVSQRREEQHINVYFMDSDVLVSHASRDGGVYLNMKADAYHEIFHILLPGKREEERWLEEGVITLLTIQTQSKYMEEDKALFFDCVANAEFCAGLSQEDQVFMNYIAEYYSEKASFPMEIDDLDFALFYEAVGVITLKKPDLPTTLGMAVIDINQRKNIFGYDSLPGEGGNGLTYPKAYVFAKYLSENYGLDTVVSVMIGDGTFQEAFQGDYEEIFSEFLADISA